MSKIASVGGSEQCPTASGSASGISGKSALIRVSATPHVSNGSIVYFPEQRGSRILFYMMQAVVFEREKNKRLSGFLLHFLSWVFLSSEFLQFLSQ